ncbi:hypothetical protein PV783_24680 [Chitinophaga sp. CC14]|uniref:hypothetical protein n=1 Tax=Chitinophaga sp. CC14 TaxID=3029199 RepID=UPI003B7F2967
MLYQLKATIDHVEFVALVCTRHADLYDLPDEPADKNLLMYYQQLKEQIARHRKKGLAAEYTYPWPLLSIGFDHFKADSLFSKWKRQKWMAFSEDSCSLIGSPLERKTVPPGQNLYKGLHFVRRIGIHPLLMIKLQPSGPFSKN